MKNLLKNRKEFWRQYRFKLTIKIGIMSNCHPILLIYVMVRLLINMKKYRKFLKSKISQTSSKFKYLHNRITKILKLAPFKCRMLQSMRTLESLKNDIIGPRRKPIIFISKIRIIRTVSSKWKERAISHAQAEQKWRSWERLIWIHRHLWYQWVHFPSFKLMIATLCIKIKI